MSLGFPPQHIVVTDTTGLDQNTILSLAVATCTALNWKVTVLNPAGLKAVTPVEQQAWNEAFYLVLQGTDMELRSVSLGRQVIDLGRNKQHIDRFLDTFYELKAEISPGQLAEGAIHVADTLEGVRPMPLQLSRIADDPAFLKFLLLFVPGRRYVATPLLIYLNIVVFLFGWMLSILNGDPRGDWIAPLAANHRAHTMSGQWWRLITCIFIHANTVHLLSNVLALTFIGLLLEPYLGYRRLFLAFMLTGICASTVSVLWHLYDSSIGASGAIFGLYGVFIGMLFMNKNLVYGRKSLVPGLLFFIFYSLYNGLAEGIDNAAHVGGLVSGFFWGIAITPVFRQGVRASLTWLYLSGPSLILLSAVTLALRQGRNPVDQYYAHIRGVDTLANQTTEIENQLHQNGDAGMVLKVTRLEHKWNDVYTFFSYADTLGMPQFWQVKNYNIRQISRYEYYIFKNWRLFLTSHDTVHFETMQVYREELRELLQRQSFYQ